MNPPVKATGFAGGLDSGCQKSPAEAGLFRTNYANEDKGARQLRAAGSSAAENRLGGSLPSLV